MQRKPPLKGRPTISGVLVYYIWDFLAEKTISSSVGHDNVPAELGDDRQDICSMFALDALFSLLLQ